MSTSHKFKISHLEMVFPPISNQDAFLVKDEPRVEMLMRQSDFYMIAGKPRYEFSNFKFDNEEQTIEFAISLGGSVLDTGVVYLAGLPIYQGEDDILFAVTHGKTFIAILDGPSSSAKTRIIERYTPESIIWARSRSIEGIFGLDKFRELSVYDLLYVGIAKVGDSYDRLIAKGHQARMDILSNEPQRYPGARVSDEIFLFLFTVVPTIMQTFELDHEFTDEDVSGNYEAKRIVADAEKAYVSLLKPQYNFVKFNGYPRGKDGLYEKGFDRYGYCIGEAVIFNTAHGKIKGGRHPLMGAMSNDADCIFVEGDNVTLYVSGVDFPADE